MGQVRPHWLVAVDRRVDQPGLQVIQQWGLAGFLSEGAKHWLVQQSSFSGAVFCDRVRCNSAPFCMELMDQVD